MERIPILENGREVSHLAVRFDPPRQAGPPLHPLPPRLRLRADGREGGLLPRNRRSTLALASAPSTSRGMANPAAGPPRPHPDPQSGRRPARPRLPPRSRPETADPARLLHGRRHGPLVLRLPSRRDRGRPPHRPGPGDGPRPPHLGRPGKSPPLGRDRNDPPSKTTSISCDLGWTLIEDLRAHPLETLLTRYQTPCLLLQGKQDTSVSWRSVLDFATRCTFREIELHLFIDGDHRLTDRKDRLWGLMMELLRGRKLE